MLSLFVSVLGASNSWLLAPLVVAADGDVDTSFNAKVSDSFNVNINTVAIQADGKVLIGGNFISVNGVTRNYIARLNADDSLDTGFLNGQAGANEIVVALALQPDGKILIGGEFTAVNEVARNGIARLNADGTLDTSFLNGQAGTNNLGVEALALQPDGKILIGGNFTNVNGVVRNNVARLNADGTLDTNFLDSQTGANGSVEALALQPDGKILIGGGFFGVGVPARIARLNGDGTLDTNFGQTGLSGFVRALALQPDGKILMGGLFLLQGGVASGVQRLNANGTLDTSFLNGQAGANSFVHAIALQSDNKILIGGFFTSVNGVVRHGVARLNADGTLDTNFLVGLTAPNEGVSALALQPDGKILISGFFTSVNGVARNRFARLNTDGTLDTNFLVGLAGNPFVEALALQPNGKTLIGGDFDAVNSVTRNRVARLNADGTLDTGFLNGQAGANDEVDSIALQPDGKILIGGLFTSVNGVARNFIARLNADGTLDTGFLNGQAGASDSVDSLALQPDGKILIGGFFTSVNGVARNFIARLNADGTLDTNFLISLAGAKPFDFVKALAVQPDGKILIGGDFTSVNGVGRNNVARLNADGTLDTGFLNGQAGVNDEVDSIVLQPDGKIVIGGNFDSVNGVTRNFIARLNADGTLDTSFLDSQTGANGSVDAISLQPDGKVLIGGCRDADNGIARLNADGTRDTNFLSGQAGTNACASALALQPNGKILISGFFTTVNNVSRTGVARLLNDPFAPGGLQFSAPNYSVNENNSNATITVTRTGGSFGAVAVNYAASNGTATAGSDYTPTSGILSFANGETSKTFSIPILDDALFELDETVNLTLNSPTGGATLGAPSSAVLTIISDDGNLKITGHVVDDAAHNIGAVTVTLSGGASGSTTSDSSGNYSFANLTTGGNYTVTPSSGNFSFSPANQTFNNLSVDRIANFVGTQTVVIITGKVTDSNNVGINNVTLALSKDGAAAGIVQTDVLGNYSFGNLAAGANYVVTPAGSFIPSNQAFSNLTVNASANFVAAPSIPSQCNTASFAPASNFTTGTGTESVAVGDFNGDGKLDLAVVNGDADSVSILIGTGTGSFSAATNFAVGSAPKSVAVGDFNGDSKLDLAVTNRISANVSILLGTGTGSFSAATNFAVGAFPNSIAVGDFNGDGKLDLAVTSANDNSVSILLGTGTGSFSPKTNFAAGTAPAFVAVGDFNGDGKLDLAVANATSNNVSILLGTGTGSFSAATNFAVGSTPVSVAVGDFNGDGKLDLATAGTGSTNVSILLGTGTGSFSAAINFAAGVDPHSVAVGDFNGDGKLDLAVANPDSDNASILLGTGTGSFSASTTNFAGVNPLSVAVGDFNGDGKLDLAVQDSGPENGVSILLNNGTICNLTTSLSVSGRTADSKDNSLPDVTVTLSGPVTRVVRTDANGNYTFSNLAPGGNYSVTIQSPYFVFGPSRADLFNLSSDQTEKFTAAPVVVPAPAPLPNDDFGGSTRDPSKWSLGTLTQPAAAFDPQVSVNQINGQLVITPLTQASGLHYNGYVSANSFDLTNGSASVEVVKAATGGADTIFAIGSDSDNFFRFLVHTAGGPSGVVTMIKAADGIERPLDTMVAQLIFQVKVGGQLTSLSIPYDPVQDRFMRFRHEPATNSIVFETSPNDIDYTVQNRVLLQKGVSALTAELSAGTSNPTNPGQTIFDNFKLVTSTFQFSSASYTVGEGDGSVLVTVTRVGSTAEAASVDYATADGTAAQRTKYVNAVGTLSFAPGESSKSFSILIVDNVQAEGNETMNVLLANAVGSGLNNPGRTVLNIIDNDTTLATGNPLDDPRFFVQQQYFDFLNRAPDDEGLAYWMSQITSCPPGDQLCVNARRIRVSNAFFFELEFQQTGAYVYRLYRAAYGNKQPFPNSDADPKYPGENLKVPSYAVFVPDRARVVGGASLAQAQLELANAFVQRAEFLAKYPASLDEPGFVDAVLATIKNDTGADLTAQRAALLNLFNQGGRGAVMYRLADDNEQTNPIDNRAFIDAEYRRAFVTTEYFGYLRRDADIGGLLFWLGQVNRFPLRNVDIQNAMVCSFITSLEYQQRFSPLTTHSNQECPQ